MHTSIAFFVGVRFTNYCETFYISRSTLNQKQKSISCPIQGFAQAYFTVTK